MSVCRPLHILFAPVAPAWNATTESSRAPNVRCTSDFIFSPTESARVIFKKSNFVSPRRGCPILNFNPMRCQPTGHRTSRPWKCDPRHWSALPSPCSSARFFACASSAVRPRATHGARILARRRSGLAGFCRRAARFGTPGGLPLQASVCSASSSASSASMPR